jgi:hypothetical protein
VSYDLSGRSQEWIDGFLEGQRVTLREIEPLTLKTENGRFVKVQLHPAVRARWTEPSGAVATAVGQEESSDMGIYFIMEDPS